MKRRHWIEIAQAANLVVENQKTREGKGTLAEAVGYFIENRPQQSPTIIVQEVVELLVILSITPSCAAGAAEAG